MRAMKRILTLFISLALLDATVADMLSVQRANGSFSCVPPEHWTSK